MSVRICMKRLVDVEIDPHASHQHEFNAGALRKELGFREKTSGDLDFLIHVNDESPPKAIRESYTLYDARERHPTRTEWRMYYTHSAITGFARAGDLMLVFRPDREHSNLVALIVRSGTEKERQLVRDLAQRDPEDLLSDLFVDSSDLDHKALPAGPTSFHLLTAGKWDDAVKSHPLFTESVDEGGMRSTKEMAGAAQSIISQHGVQVDDPDEFFSQALEAETALFYAIEDEMGNRELIRMRENGALSFEAVMKYSTSCSQRRKSRRGRSVELHFEKILKEREILYDAQKTHQHQKPDFIFPSVEALRDPGFPDRHLRLVACKSRGRERFAEILPEADRIQLKYCLTVDEKLTKPLIAKYEGKIKFFLPIRHLNEHYHDKEFRNALGSVAELVTELEAAASAST